MIYQESFQSGENPSEINVSSCIYYNGFKQKDSEEIEFKFPNHCHSFYEINYYFEGEGDITVNRKFFHTNKYALYLVPPLAVHGSVGHSRSINLVLQFGYNFLSRNASTFPKDAMLMPANEMLNNGMITVKRGDILEQYMEEIEKITPRFITPFTEAQHIDYSVKYEWKLNALMLSLIEQLLETGNLVIENNVGNAAEVIKIQSVLNRLITHPEEKISMEEAARMACMGYSNFSRTFAQVIGRTFVDYCNETKVHRAQEYLESSNMSVTQISQLLCFGSVSYFNRIFKHYTGNTPMQYRDKLKRI